MKKIPVLLTALVLILVGTAAFAEGNVIKFDQKVNTVFEGEPLQTVLILEGEPATGEISYVSANEKVATVDEKGVVTGVAKGRSTITAVSKTEIRTFKTQLTVTVARKAESIEVDTRKLPLHEADDPQLSGLLKAEGENLPVLMVPVKKRISLQANVLPKEATNRKAVFTTADESVAIAKGNNVTGVATGETVLNIASESNPEVAVQYRVLVVQPVTRLALEPRNPTVAKGSQVNLSASLLPEDASIQAIDWSSQNEKVATVDENGVVTGMERGNARIVATATDGSNVRANISVRVTQSAEEITLDKTEMTLDAGRSGVIRATVLPKNTDDKKVIWTSSDESIATVNNSGRVTAVALGTCTITCSSASTEGVSASATVTVQQPVTKIVFGDAPVVYVDENAQLTWSVEPANASNPALTFASNNTKVLTVSEDGTVTGIKGGTATVIATSTDGSNRKAKIQIKVCVHATGVHMYRNTAYVNVGESATCKAVLEPKEASDNRMSWQSDDVDIAEASGEATQLKIHGVSEGTTRITGTTADGGFQTSIEVKIGDWDRSLKLTAIDVDGRGNLTFRVKNVSDLFINYIHCEVEFYNGGKEVDVNTENGSNKVKVTYKRDLSPGNSTKDDKWNFENYHKPDDGFDHVIVRIAGFQIDRDWVKNIQPRRRPKIEWHR